MVKVGTLVLFLTLEETQELNISRTGRQILYC